MKNLWPDSCCVGFAKWSAFTERCPIVDSHFLKYKGVPMKNKEPLAYLKLHAIRSRSNEKIKLYENLEAERRLKRLDTKFKLTRQN
jgi:hypothetical protein